MFGMSVLAQIQATGAVEGKFIAKGRRPVTRRRLVEGRKIRTTFFLHSYRFFFV